MRCGRITEKMGAWELGVRWSSIDISDGLVDGGEMDILSLGVAVTVATS